MKKQIFAMIGIMVAVLVLFSIRTVTSQASCNGQYNMQLKATDLPETRINGTISRIFVLPEAWGFQKIYQFFSVAKAKAIISCPSYLQCSVYVNNQACGLEIPIGGAESLFELPCPHLFHDGVNTLDIRPDTTSSLRWLFLETKVDSVWCW